MNKRDRSVPSSEFGLVAWLEATRVVLPLKGVECRFDVTGTIGCVELDQIYHQNMDRPVDCTYTFPLPAGAAVYRCELHVNGRVIRAKVEEQVAARKIFREQKAAGRRAALVETERENLFTLSLGNVQPEDVIVVRFAWFQVIDREADTLRLRVPTCPGVRYIPGEPLLRANSGRGVEGDTNQVPDASRISPPRIDALHPDAAYFSIEGRLSSADVNGATVSSPSHSVFVREKDEQVMIALSKRAEVPDCDFVLSWRERKARELAPQTWCWKAGKETYALVQLRAPSKVPVAKTSRQDFYFLIDRSGSMQGAKWQRTCEALTAFVKLLGAEDRVWITLYESAFLDFAEAPMRAPEVLADRGFQRMMALGVAGGTELLPAAEHVMTKIAEFSKNRRASVVIITDGQVGNEAEISSAFQKIPKVRVHTFGIDTAVNDAFLKELARRHRGGCWLQTPDDDIAGTIAGLGSRLRRPVITDLAVSGGWKTGSETWPDLHAEELVTISLRGKAGKPIEISGRLADGAEHCFVVPLKNQGSEAVKLLWAKERITALLEKGQQAEAIALAREHNLICRGAAFIAWDEAEQVQIAKEEIVQPALAQRHVLCAAPLRAMHGYLADSDDSDVQLASMNLSSPAPRMKAKASGRNILDIIKSQLGSPSAAEIEAAEELEQQKLMQAVVPKVREAFQKLGASEQSIATWLAEAQKGKATGASPFWVLLPSAVLMERIRSDRKTPRKSEMLEGGIVRALNGTLEELLSWYREVNPTSVIFLRILGHMKSAKVPLPFIDFLCAWVCESGMPDAGRMKKLHQHAESLWRLPFSVASKWTHWQTFLDDAVGVGSEVHAEASRMLVGMFEQAEEAAAAR